MPVLKKREKNQTNNTILHFEDLEKKEQTKPKAEKRGIIIKIMVETN